MDCDKCRNKALKTAAEVQGNNHTIPFFCCFYCIAATSRMNKKTFS